MKLNLTSTSNRVASILTTNGLDPERIVRPGSNFDPSEFRRQQVVGSRFHGLKAGDNLVINGKRGGGVGLNAWHGLGLNVLGVHNPLELLRMGGLDWDVEQLPIVGVLPLSEGQEYNDVTQIDTHVLNVRSDTKAALGVVGSGYKPFHNRELADLVTQLGEGVEVETIGTIHNGKRVWFLVRGETIAVTDRDQTQTYLMIAAGHDGSMAVQAFWTSVRAVCLSTFRRAIGGRKGGIVIRHEGKLESKIGDLRNALGLMGAETRAEAAEAMALNAREMKTEDVQRFFLEVYSRAVAPIPAKPETESEQKARDKALDVISEWGQLFDADRARTGNGATAWTAFNAVTEWYDHRSPVKGKNDAARRDNATYAALWGTAADRKATAREVALEII